jgi:hypothetical protein
MKSAASDINSLKGRFMEEIVSSITQMVADTDHDYQIVFTLRRRRRHPTARFRSRDQIEGKAP